MNKKNVDTLHHPGRSCPGSRLLSGAVVMMLAAVSAAISGYGAVVETNVHPGAEEAVEAYLSDTVTVPRWCRWTLVTPGASLYDSGAISASGVSPVEIVWEKDNSNFDWQYFVIKGFRGLCDMWIPTVYYKIPDGSTLCSGIGDFNKVKYLRSDIQKGGFREVTKSKVRTQGTDKYITFGDYNTRTTARLCEATINARGNLEFVYDIEDGYCLFFGTDDGLLPEKGSVAKSKTIEYYRSLRIEFFTATPNAGRSVDGERKETAATVTALDFDGTEGKVGVTGLYGHGTEQRADCFDPYAKEITPESTPVDITLRADGTAVLDLRWRQAGPVLNTFLEPMAVKAGGASYAEAPATDAANRRLWLRRKTTSPVYCSEMLLTPGDAAGLTSDNVSDGILADFNVRIRSNGLSEITGRWWIEAGSDTQKENSHWNRPGSDRILKIEMDPHYIVPVVYSCSSADIGLKTPQLIESLSLDVAVGGVSMSQSFVVDHYGNGRTGSGPETSLYISARILSPKIENVYIVRGTIDDYTAEKLGDAVKGHSNGILISGGDYDTDFSPAGATESLQTENEPYRRLNVLVPDARIPGQNAADKQYTLYGSTHEDGKTRFEQLAVLDRTTTGVSQHIATESGNLHIEGHILFADAKDVEVFDLAGRSIAKADAGSSVELPAGAFLVKAGADTRLVSVRY